MSEATSFTLADIVRAHADARPEQVAFTFDGRDLTFAELDRRSSCVAAALAESGVRRGDLVAVLMKNRLEYFEVVFGCNKIGATVVALNWRLAPVELAAVLADADPRVVVVDEEHLGRLRSPADSPEARRVVVGDDYEPWLAGAPDVDPWPRQDPGDRADDVAVVLYSSGTTGLPKGIMITNSNLSYLERMARELFRMRQDSVHLVGSPLFHIGGLGTGLTLTALGGRSVLMSTPSPSQILDTIERERVTHAFFVPTVIQQLVDLAEAGDRDLSSLEVIAYGAAPMTETLLRRALTVLGCGFVGCYGMTETAGTVVALPPEEHVAEGPRARLLRSVGKPLPWQEVRLVDPATRADVAVGQVGEIWVRSGSTTAGYLHQPEATAQTLAGDGWLRTGDTAYADEEGWFFLQDRLKDMIISGGENVYPAEVENVLATHSAVADVAVIGTPHPKWGETVTAVVLRRPGQEVTPEELIAFARRSLAGYKCPTSVHWVEDFPRTATGKIQKNVLRTTYAG